MKVLAVLLLLAGVASAQWELVFEDNFNGDTINPAYWEHEVTASGGGNSEFQVYTPDSANSFVQDGNLNIKPTLLRDNINPATGQPYGEDFLRNGYLDLEALYGYCTDGNPDGCSRPGSRIPPVASARVRSANKFAFRYGRVEINAKMPVGDWLWPAMWMLPDNWMYGGWPMSGEIDITEGIGNRDFYCGNYDYRGIQHMASTLHWGQQVQDNRYYLTQGGNTNHDRNYADHFHLYEMEWDPQGMTFFIDGQRIVTIPGGQKINEYEPGDCFLGFFEFGKYWSDDTTNVWVQNYHDYLMAPFDQEFHFIFNVAVGGTNGFIPDNCVNQGGESGKQKPWNNGLSQEAGMWAFYDNEWAWKPTWDSEGDNFNMQIDYVRVYQQEEGYDRTQTPQWCPPPPCE